MFFGIRSCSKNLRQCSFQRTVSSLPIPLVLMFGRFWHLILCQHATENNLFPDLDYLGPISLAWR